MKTKAAQLFVNAFVMLKCIALVKKLSGECSSIFMIIKTKCSVPRHEKNSNVFSWL